MKKDETKKANNLIRVQAGDYNNEQRARARLLIELKTEQVVEELDKGFYRVAKNDARELVGVAYTLFSLGFIDDELRRIATDFALDSEEIAAAKIRATAF